MMKIILKCSCGNENPEQIIECKDGLNYYRIKCNNCDLEGEESPIQNRAFENFVVASIMEKFGYTVDDIETLKNELERKEIEFDDLQDEYYSKGKELSTLEDEIHELGYIIEKLRNI